MFIYLCFIWTLVISQPILPPYFITVRDGFTSSYPAATSMNQRVYFDESSSFTKCERQLTFPDRQITQTQIVEYDDVGFRTSYTYVSDFFGQAMAYPLCVYGYLEVDPFIVPTMGKLLGNAKVNGTSVEIWNTADDVSWWYLAESPLTEDIFVPYAVFTFFDNAIFRFQEFMLEKPSPEDFIPPRCFDLTHPIPTPKPNLPTTFSATIDHGGIRLTEIYRNSNINAAAQRISFPTTDGSTFTWSMVQRNGTRFTYTNYFTNIYPPPCFATVVGEVFSWPDFSKLGSMSTPSNGMVDLYLGDHQLWVIKNNSEPIGIFDVDFPPAQFTSFVNGPPTPDIFRIPPLCFGEIGGKKRTTQDNFPDLPDAYTLLLNYYDTFQETIGKMSVYYDSKKNMKRLDTPYMTQIQLSNNDIYTMVNSDGNFMKGIDPLPCFILPNSSFTIWSNPSFEKFLGNATISGKPAKVLLDDKLDSEILTVWYLTMDNIPLYYFAAFTFFEVTSYQPQPPTPSVFNVPSSCIKLGSNSILEKRFFPFTPTRRLKSRHLFGISPFI